MEYSVHFPSVDYSGGLWLGHMHLLDYNIVTRKCGLLIEREDHAGVVRFSLGSVVCGSVTGRSLVSAATAFN